MQKTESPLMKQYHDMKKKYPDAILLFRVGDFYETFNEDAFKTSKILGITLTKRNNKNKNSETLAGFPHHALDTYLHKIVKAGYRVAICEQLEDPKKAKGIVKRGVTEIVTPGIALHDKLLDPRSNNYLLALQSSNDTKSGIAFADISTAEFFVYEGKKEDVERWIWNIQPAEILLSKNMTQEEKEKYKESFFNFFLDDWVFDADYAEDVLKKHFEVHSLKGFGLENQFLAIQAAGAIIHYLNENHHHKLKHLKSMRRIDDNEFMWMDSFTIRNLELFETNFQNGISFYETINKTLTTMGARMLKKWILMPLQNLNKIQKRNESVKYLMHNDTLSEMLIKELKMCSDLDRLASKIPSKKINPRETLFLAKTLDRVQSIKKLTEETANEQLKNLSNLFNALHSISQKIQKILIETPPIHSNKGNVIAQGVCEELDKLKNISTSGKNYLLELQKKEILATSIPSLKIGFNNVFGYYLEVTHIHKDKVPQDWIRKQTLTNAERYITPELKEYETKILGAEEKILVLEAELFASLVNELEEFLNTILINGDALAQLDCLIAFTLLAKEWNYCLPKIYDKDALSIIEGRHPVVEQNMQAGEKYIPNDLYLGQEKNQQIIILTGPNMSGKSAILRQTALIILLAHIGSYVPAKEATIPLTDKIFTRVGASDNLYSGESTFMVEMNETSNILNNLSEKSILFLDEIGRGTSTYDGVSISWALTEYLHSMSAYKPKTIFATHYHELNELEKKLKNIKNFHISHIETDGKVIFLRKLKAGGSNKSFGIHVAKMAGFPKHIIERANVLLKELEKERNENTLSHLSIEKESPQKQIKFFDEKDIQLNKVKDILKQLDLNRISPIDALLKLKEIKDSLE